MKTDYVEIKKTETDKYCCTLHKLHMHVPMPIKQWYLVGVTTFKSLDNSRTN